jgi:hypothetical protein
VVALDPLHSAKEVDTTCMGMSLPLSFFLALVLLNSDLNNSLIFYSRELLC